MLLGATWLAAACGDLFGPRAGSPAELEVLFGAGQEGPVGSLLGRDLAVRVVDDRGRAVEGVAVAWNVVAGDGQITPLSAATDGEGRVTARWRLGPAAGEQRATAVVDDLAPAVFTANAVAGPPARILIVSGNDQSGVAGTVLPEPLVVRVTDSFENPLSGATVTWTTQHGGGVVVPATSQTDGDGRAAAEWTLGSSPGQNSALASTTGVTPAVFFATATAGPPATLTRLSGDEQVGAIGTALPAALSVRVTDAEGNPIPGVPVTWTVEGGDQIAPASSVTSDAGTATAVWTLGGSPTVRTATAAIPDVPPVSFTARAFAPLQNRVPVDGVAGTAGSFSYYRLDVPQGTGRLDAAVSGASGQLTLHVRPGELPTLDDHVCRAPAAGGAAECSVQTPEPGAWYVMLHGDAAFSGATLLAGYPFNMLIAAATISQAAQNLEGSVPLMAGRDGLLRVFVLANEANSIAAPVRVRLFQNGAPVETWTVSSPGPSVPTTVNEGSLSSSWNVFIPADRIQPGVSLLVELDPFEEVPEDEDRSDNVFPASGEPLPLNVVTMPTFDVLFVPVRQSSNNLTGNVTEANAEQFLTSTRRLLPVVDVDWAVRQVYVTDQTLTSGGQGWGALLSEINNLRTTTGDGRYYYGVVRTAYTQGVAGIGMVPPTSNNFCCRAALGWDFFPVAHQIAAHEWGHNFGRWHAPCGVQDGLDASYPYQDGSIGIVGVDPQGPSLFSPAVYRDVMSYCFNALWVSDYTFSGILNFRMAGGSHAVAAPGAGGGAAVAAGGFGGPPEPVLVVSGRTEAGRLILDPAFRIDARPSLPDRPGPFVLEGFDGEGERLFAFSFDGVGVGDLPGDVRLFSFAIPQAMAPADRLASLRVTGPGFGAARREAAAPADAPVAPEAVPQTRRLPGDAVEVTWDTTANPLIVVRDPATGNILSFARSGALTLPDAPQELEFIVSDGVRSVTRRPPPR